MSQHIRVASDSTVWFLTITHKPTDIIMIFYPVPGMSEIMISKS